MLMARIPVRNIKTWINCFTIYAEAGEIPEPEHGKPCIAGRFNEHEANGLTGHDILGLLILLPFALLLKRTTTRLP